MTESALSPSPISIDHAAGVPPRPTFWLFRIVGNALPPRHSADHHVRTAKYILDHEPPLSDCRKTWIINQIVDPAESRLLTDMLRARGEHVVEIPFDPLAAAQAHLDASGLPDELLHPGGALDVLTDVWRFEWLLRHKSLALANVNRARNVALRMGRPIARWTLPLDGGVMFTRAGWAGMCDAITSHPQAKFAAIGFVRVGDYGEVEQVSCPDPRACEPQIAFREDSVDEFDETLRYGHRNKVELLGRIGASGAWLGNANAPWDRSPSQVSPDHGAVCWGGFVVRLPTGASAVVERDNPARWLARFSGVAKLALAVDVARGRAAAAASCPWTTYTDPQRLDEAPRGRLEMLAERIVRMHATPVPADSIAVGPNAVSRLARDGSVLAVAGALCGPDSAAIAMLEALMSSLLVTPSMRIDPRHAWKRIPLRELWLVPQTLDILAATARGARTAKAAAGWCGEVVDEFMKMPGAQPVLSGCAAPTAATLWTKAVIAALSVAAGRSGDATLVAREVPIDLVALSRASGAAETGVELHEWFDIAAALAALIVTGRRVGVDLLTYRGRSGEGIAAVWDKVNILMVAGGQSVSDASQTWFEALKPVLSGSAAGGETGFITDNPLGIPPLWPALAPRGL